MIRVATGLLLELLFGKVFFSISLLSRGFPGLLDSDDVLAHHSHTVAQLLEFFLHVLRPSEVFKVGFEGCS